MTCPSGRALEIAKNTQAITEFVYKDRRFGFKSHDYPHVDAAREYFVFPDTGGVCERLRDSLQNSNESRNTR